MFGFLYDGFFARIWLWISWTKTQTLRIPISSGNPCWFLISWYRNSIDQKWICLIWFQILLEMRNTVRPGGPLLCLNKIDFLGGWPYIRVITRADGCGQPVTISLSIISLLGSHRSANQLNRLACPIPAALFLTTLADSDLEQSKTDLASKKTLQEGCIVFWKTFMKTCTEIDYQ